MAEPTKHQPNPVSRRNGIALLAEKLKEENERVEKEERRNA
jgi:hypothetical protein